MRKKAANSQRKTGRKLALTPEFQALYFQCLAGKSLHLSPADQALIVQVFNRQFPALPRAAKEAQQRKRDWRQILRWSLRLAAIALLLFLIVIFSGCDNRNEFSFALGHRPQQNVLRVTSTNGKTYEILLNDNIPAQNLIAIQTALSNTLILETEIVTREAQEKAHAANMAVFSRILLLIAFLSMVAGTAYVAGCYAGRGGK